MNLAISLVILSIAFVDSNQHANYTVIAKRNDDGTDNNKYTSTEIPKKFDHGTAIRTSGDRRWMSIFPKNTQKFVVTMKSIEPRNNTNPFIKLSRKTPMFKIIPRVLKNKNENYLKKVTTRQPLMKFIKFTVNPLSAVKSTTNSRNIERENARNNKYVVNKIMSASKKDGSSEEQSFTTDEKRRNDKAKQGNPSSNAFRKIRSRVVNNIKNLEQISKHKEMDGKSHTSSEFSSEEREDKREFIFIKPKEIKENAVKLINNSSSESDEITTVVFEHETKKRHKRSTNVIEEENLGTTVSGFKFTGKVASLSSDLMFRNINT